MSEWSKDTEIAIYLILTFFLGVIFSTMAWSCSIAFLLAFIVVWELVYFTVCKCAKFSWCWFYRFGISVAYFSGWLIGRSIIDGDIAFLTVDHDRKYLGDRALCKREKRRRQMESR